MSILSSLRTLASSLLHPSRLRSETDAELLSHIQLRADDLERSGVPRSEARRRARLEFGAPAKFLEECRDAFGARFLEVLAQDVRFAFRTLRKSPVFTAVAVLTLALGIGANTAIFSVVYGVLLRPLPYTDPGRLVVLLQSNPEKAVPFAGSDYEQLIDWRRQTHSFTSLAGAQRHQLTLTGVGDPTVVRTVVVTPEMFSLLDARPIAGRVFVPSDGEQGAAPVVILSQSLWRSRFAANPAVIGSSITLDQRSFSIVGVMPANFKVPIFTENQDVWIPILQDPLFGPWTATRGRHFLPIAARLSPGVTVAQAQSEMDTLAARFASEYPEDKGWIVHVDPLQAVLVSDFKSALLILLGAVALVLLIACVNLANLLLARATSRTKEIALRLALGAARARIFRQLLTESAVLGSLGAVIGILFAFWGVRALTAFLPPDLPQFNQISVDGRVLAFALLLSFFASLAFGLAPALLAASSDPQTNLKESASRSGETGARRRARSFLAAAEMAVAVVLIVGAGLLVRSFASLTSVSPGFNPEHVFKAEVSLPQYQYSTPHQWSAFDSSLLERLQAQPGLASSALAVPLPLANPPAPLPFTIAGAPPLPPGTPTSADFASITPEYFRVMEIPLLRGRIFTRQDSESSPRVTIISEAFAHFYFPNQDPLGKSLVFSFPPADPLPREIVGIIGDVRDTELRKDPSPIMYVPCSQIPLWGAIVVTRTALAPSAALAEIHQVVLSLDRNLPVTDAAPLSDAFDSSVAQPKFRAWLLSLFGAVALLLASAGIFGVVSYSVSCRTQEFGVRMALGASPSIIQRMVLRESLRLAASGLAIGVIGALALAQFLKSQLYGVTTKDPFTFAAAVVLLLTVALVAASLPARRAMRTDPMSALRHE